MAFMDESCEPCLKGLHETNEVNASIVNLQSETGRTPITMKALPLLFLICCLIGCTTQVLMPGQQGVLFTQQMPDLMPYDGFSIRRPDDLRWVLALPIQTPNRAIFAMPQPTETHTFFSSVELQKITLDPSHREALKTHIDQELQIHGSRHEILSYNSQLMDIQGRWAVTYKMTVLDKAALVTNQPLRIHTKGFIVMHPTKTRTIIHALYSQRGLESEIDPELFSVGDAFLKGVVIEAEPGKPQTGLTEV